MSSTHHRRGRRQSQRRHVAGPSADRRRRGGGRRHGQVSDLQRGTTRHRPRPRRPAIRAGQRGDGESQLAMLRRLELTREMHEALMRIVEPRGIGFFLHGLRSAKRRSAGGARRRSDSRSPPARSRICRIFGMSAASASRSSCRPAWRRWVRSSRRSRFSRQAVRRASASRCSIAIPNTRRRWRTSICARCCTIRRGIRRGGGLFRPHTWDRGADRGGGPRRHGHREALHARSDAARAGPQGKPGARGAQSHGRGDPQHRDRPSAMGSSDRARARRRTSSIARKSLVAARGDSQGRDVHAPRISPPSARAPACRRCAGTKSSGARHRRDFAARRVDRTMSAAAERSAW